MTPREAVTQALEQGHSDPRLIACITTLRLDQVRTQLGRLADNRKVVKISKHCWKLKKDQCLLAECWR